MKQGFKPTASWLQDVRLTTVPQLRPMNKELEELICHSKVLRLPYQYFVSGLICLFPSWSSAASAAGAGNIPQKIYVWGSISPFDLSFAWFIVACRQQLNATTDFRLNFGSRRYRRLAGIIWEAFASDSQEIELSGLSGVSGAFWWNDSSFPRDMKPSPQGMGGKKQIGSQILNPFGV